MVLEMNNLCKVFVCIPRYIDTYEKNACLEVVFRCVTVQNNRIGTIHGDRKLTM
jgi:hypothetical protein